MLLRKEKHFKSIFDGFKQWRQNDVSVEPGMVKPSGKRWFSARERWKCSGTLLTMLFRDNCIQNVHLGRYIVGCMVGNFVLHLNVISDHITDNIPPQNENFEYGYPHSNALF